MPDKALRVLVVEDNPDTAQMLDAMVQGWGYRTRVATDGRRALLIASDFHPHVVLLDLILPDQHGYEIAQQLRQETPSHDLLCMIAITGWGQNADQQRSTAAGFSHHLVKPVDPKALETILARCQERENERV